MREAILATSTKRRRLRDAYRFVGFRPLEQVRGMFGDRHARVIRLVRRSKKRPAAVVGRCGRAGMTARSAARAIWPAGACAFEVRRVDCRCCGKVKRERLEFLADNPLYTKRFAFYVGRRCRSAPIRDVAKELKLDWHTVKE